jgi:uncharacterized protein (DUF927 family)
MNYRDGVKKRLEEVENGDKEIKRNEKVGRALVEIQISQLKSDVATAEYEVEKCEDAYVESKYAMPFDLKSIDRAELEVKKAKKNLDNIKDDLKSRESLMKDLFPGK